MSFSPYFEELTSAYSAELDDLMTDSEGRSAIKKRLNEKRKQFEALLPMIEFSPEMVAVTFYNAFSFHAPQMMRTLMRSEPDDDDFLVWEEIKDNLSVADWAQPLVDAAIEADGGDVFLVSSAALEFHRLHDSHSAAKSASAEPDEHDTEDDDNDEQESDDLGESGSNWLAEQGFETIDAN